LEYHRKAAEKFASGSEVGEVRGFGKGRINTTFLVTFNSPFAKPFILQQINTRVFLDPAKVMANMRTSTRHLEKRLEADPPADGRRWEVPSLLPTRQGGDYWVDPQGGCWRALRYVEGAYCRDVIVNDQEAREVGYALGLFHRLVSDLPTDRLADTLEGFHVTPKYLQHHRKILSVYRGGISPEILHCLQFIRQRERWAHVLENARMRGELRLRTIHGDPKVNNILFDEASARSVSLVDLDTVKPGLIHYDIGDCLRSGCNKTGEHTGDRESTRFDADFCRAILEGYRSAAGDGLSEGDREYFFEAIRLIAFELGLRFLNDYLEGNVYFKVDHPEDNLMRALVQFRLTESIEEQEADLRAIIQDLR